MGPGDKIHGEKRAATLACSGVQLSDWTTDQSLSGKSLPPRETFPVGYSRSRVACERRAETSKFGTARELRVKRGIKMQSRDAEINLLLAKVRELAKGFGCGSSATPSIL
jgi:hypothetical protein